MSEPNVGVAAAFMALVYFVGCHVESVLFRGAVFPLDDPVRPMVSTAAAFSA